MDRTRTKHIAKQAAAFFAAAVAYYVVFQLFYNMLKYDSPVPYEDWAVALVSIAYNFIPILLMIALNLAVVFLPFNFEAITKRLPLKISLDIVLSFAVMIGFNWLFLAIFKERGVDWAGTVFNNTFILLGVEVVYYVGRFRRSIERTELARREALQYQYDALKAQVNPHFLFNSLNILYSLISIDQQKSKEFILALSQMYRYIMSQQNRQTVPLAEELEFLGSYIAVLEMRYTNQFSVEIVGAEQAAERTIIPYTLQLLIENVTRHNVISTRSPMRVRLVVGEQYATITNPVRRKNSESVSHMGLRYLTELYKLYGKSFRVEDDGKTFTAIIPYI